MAGSEDREGEGASKKTPDGSTGSPSPTSPRSEPDTGTREEKPVGTDPVLSGDGPDAEARFQKIVGLIASRKANEQKEENDSVFIDTIFQDIAGDLDSISMFINADDKIGAKSLPKFVLQRVYDDLADLYRWITHDLPIPSDEVKMEMVKRRNLSKKKGEK